MQSASRKAEKRHAVTPGRGRSREAGVTLIELLVVVTIIALFASLVGPRLFRQVGEETGHLDSMFERLATIYENETRVAIRRLTALFEPVVILGMGLTVGVIVLSLLLAITSINDVPF